MLFRFLCGCCQLSFYMKELYRAKQLISAHFFFFFFFNINLAIFSHLFIFVLSVSKKSIRLFTCSHTGHIQQPPFRNTRQNCYNSVSSLQATCLRKYISCFPGQKSQLFKAPFHLFSFIIYPPKSWICWSSSILECNRIYYKWQTLKGLVLIQNNSRLRKWSFVISLLRVIPTFQRKENIASYSPANIIQHP